MDKTLKENISFRLPAHLIDRLRQLSKSQNRSLNNYVETIVLDAVYNEPNEVTLAAMKDAVEGRLEGPLDVSSVEAMIKSIGL